MYRTINIVNDIIPIAEKFVLENDRSFYNDFFVDLEKFVAESGAVIGGKMGMYLLLGLPIDRDTYSWDIYVENPDQFGRQLVDRLYRSYAPHINHKYILLRTDIRHKEFTIIINTRLLIKIYLLDQYKGVNLVQLMGPVSRHGLYSGANLMCVPEELQLIEIYRNLYTPAKIGKWAESIDYESKLYDIIKDNIKSKVVSQKIGGGNLAHKQGNIIGKLEKLMLEFIKSRKLVIIGDFAAQKLGEIIERPRLQFLCDIGISELVSNFTKKLELENLQVKVKYVRFSLNIPTDFQIAKHTLYAEFGGKSRPFVDIFNSPTYEMIPYWEIDNYRVANPWVILRFRFIDLWILKLILALDSENAAMINEKTNSVIDSVGELRLLTRQLMADDPQKLFQKVNYVGVFIDENVAKKKIIRERRQMIPMYSPYVAAKEATEVIPAENTPEPAQFDITEDISPEKD